MPSSSGSSMAFTVAGRFSEKYVSPGAKRARKPLAGEVAANGHLHGAVLERDVIEGDPGGRRRRHGDGPVRVVLVPLEATAFAARLLEDGSVLEQPHLA